jgi:hypothetical protein
LSVFWILSISKARIGQLFLLFVSGRSIVICVAVSLCNIFEAVSSPASIGLLYSSSNLAIPLTNRHSCGPRLQSGMGEGLARDLISNS